MLARAPLNILSKERYKYRKQRFRINIEKRDGINQNGKDTKKRLGKHTLNTSVVPPLRSKFREAEMTIINIQACSNISLDTDEKLVQCY